MKISFALAPWILTLPLIVACSGSSSPTVPTAPPIAPAPVAAADSSTFNVRDHGPGSHGPAGRFVEGNTLVSSVTADTSCPELSFVAEGHTITTSAQTHFTAGRCSDIVPGRPVTVQGFLLDTGTVNATHVVLKGNHPTEVEGDVAIDSLIAGTACPALGFIVDGHTVRTNTTTVFIDGVCADLTVGVHVQVKGLLQDDGSVTAMRIKFKNEDDEDEDDDD